MCSPRALSVSTTGCPFECHFCEVWDMALVASYVYLARVTEHVAGNTFCPVWQTEVIGRTGFVVKARPLQNGRCPNCDSMVAGIWG